MNVLTRDNVVAQARLHFIVKAVSALRWPLEARFAGDGESGTFDHDNGQGVSVCVAWNARAACCVVWDSDSGPTEDLAPVALRELVEPRSDALGQAPSGLIWIVGEEHNESIRPLTGSRRRLAGYVSDPADALASSPGRQGWLELADLSAAQGRAIIALASAGQDALRTVEPEEELDLLAFPGPATLATVNVIAAAEALRSAGIHWTRALSGQLAH